MKVLNIKELQKCSGLWRFVKLTNYDVPIPMKINDIGACGCGMSVTINSYGRDWVILDTYDKLPNLRISYAITYNIVYYELDLCSIHGYIPLHSDAIRVDRIAIDTIDILTNRIMSLLKCECNKNILALTIYDEFQDVLDYGLGLKSMASKNTIDADAIHYMYNEYKKRTGGE